jgi:hypothetical protein
MTALSRLGSLAADVVLAQRGTTWPMRVIQRGVLSMSHCRVERADLAVRATEFHQFIPSEASP